MNDKLSLDRVNLSHLYSINLFKISGHFVISDRCCATNLEQLAYLSNFDPRKISVSTLNIVNLPWRLKDLEGEDADQITGFDKEDLVKHLASLETKFFAAGVRSLSYTINNGSKEEDVRGFELIEE